MTHEPTPADRIGHHWNRCQLHEATAAAAARVLAAVADNAAPAELQALRQERAASQETLRRFLAHTADAFTPKGAAETRYQHHVQGPY